MNDEERSDEITALYRAIALTRKAPEGPPVTGECHNCAEPLPPGVRWCDADCRDDWQRLRPPAGRPLEDGDDRRWGEEL